MTCPEPDPGVTIPESSWQGTKVPGFTYRHSEAAGREGEGGGGKEGLTPLTFIGTPTHMPSALSDTLHI